MRRLARLSALISALLLTAGCSSSRKHLDNDIYFEATPGASIEFIGCAVKMSKKIQTVNVHPDDTPFLSGTTTANTTYGFFNGLKLGIDGSLGNEDIRGVVGANLRLNFDSSSFGNDYRTGMFDVEKQSSDPRHHTASYIYSKLDPSVVTFIPTIGIETKLDDSWKLKFEAGAPHSRFTASSGHDRNGKWSRVNAVSWDGFGVRAGIGAKCSITDNVSITFSGGYEGYRPELKGPASVDCGYGSIGISFAFPSRK